MILNEDEKIISNLILQYSGLDFREYSSLGLQANIRKRMSSKGIKSSSDYIQFLQYNEDKESEFKELLNDLTVQHSFFFRNKAHFSVLAEKILPEIISRNMFLDKKIRILCAGCASGEEAYSIAITLLENIPDPDNWDLDVLAVDISTKSLEKTKSGIYNRNSIREVGKICLNKYFVQIHDENELYQISKKVKSIVSIKYLNLLDKEYPTGFDIVFCRNVIIYFNIATTIMIINNFHRIINDEGFLFLGHSESLMGITNKFKLEDFKISMIYKKCSIKEINNQTTAEILSPCFMNNNDTDNVSAVIDAQMMINIQNDNKSRELFIRARSFFELKKYEKALELCFESLMINDSNYESQILIVDIYANTGRLDEAILECQRLILENPELTYAYFIQAILFSRKMDIPQAKKLFRKALYLDKTLSMANFNLAIIYQKEGDVKGAIKEYRNTLTLLKRFPKDDILEYSGGFKVGFVMENCIKNLTYLEEADG